MIGTEQRYEGVTKVGVLDMETNNTGGCRYETYQCTFRVL